MVKTVTVSITLRGLPDTHTSDDIKFVVGVWLSRLPPQVKAHVNKIKVRKVKSPSASSS